MTRCFFIINALLLILLSGCSKSDSPRLDLIGGWQPGLMGGWRLMKVVYVRGVTPTTIDYSHEMRVLQLRPDSSYIRQDLGTLTESGTYSIAVLRAGNLSDTMISFSSGNNNVYKRVLRMDGLQLYLDGVDAYEVYQKQ